MGSQQLEIACHVVGNPIPDVLWVRNNQTLAECTGHVLETSKQCRPGVNQNSARFAVMWMGSHSKLQVYSASHMYDGGILKCLAKSQVGKVEANLDVVVHGKKGKEVGRQGGRQGGREKVDETRRLNKRISKWTTHGTNA